MTRLYQLALRAFPRRHRDLYGVEMIDAFDRELTARAGRARLSFGFAACLNAIGTGLVERQRQRRIRKGPAFSALDFTLAWRMLLRYPGLSLVSVLGMSVGITIAAGAFTIVSMMMGTKLPLPEGERLVSLLNWDASTNNRELRLLYDLETWRELTSIEDFSVSRNIAAQPDRRRTAARGRDGGGDLGVGVPRRPRRGPRAAGRCCRKTSARARLTRW